MTTQLSQTRNSEYKYPAPAFSLFQKVVRALVVSPHLEVRQPLLRTLDTLSIDVITCSTVAQAREFLLRDTVDIVFCDEHLPDGQYSDLVHLKDGAHTMPRIVIATRTGEWELYFEALRHGAFDVIRSPWHPTDVEMVILRALREAASKGLARSASA